MKNIERFQKGAVKGSCICSYQGCKHSVFYTQNIIKSINESDMSFKRIKALGSLLFKVALGVCFALKSWKDYLLLFTYLITLGKDETFPLITKFKTNRPLTYLFVNRIPN